MNEAELTKPRRRYLPRFSLRTLLLFVLLCASGFGLRYRWEPKRRVYPLPQESQAFESGYTVSPDLRLAGAAMQDGTVLIWRIADQEKVLEKKVYSPSFGGVDFAPDSQHMVSWGGAGPARLWDCATGKELFVLDHSQGLTTASSLVARFSLDGHFLVVVSTNGADVWDAESGTHLFGLPKGGVEEGRFSTDSSLIWYSGQICELPSGKVVHHRVDIEQFRESPSPRMQKDSRFFVDPLDAPGTARLAVYRNRPAGWSPTWLPEFWLTVLFGVGLLWSLVRDFWTLRRAPA